MYKIYHIITSVQLGGAEIVAFDLANYCSDENSKKYNSTIIELYPTNNDYSKAKKEELELKGISVLTLFNGSKKMSLMFAFIKLSLLINKERPNIIHSHTDLPDFVLSLALRLLQFTNKYSGLIFRTIHNTQLWRTHNKIGKFTEKAFINDSIIGVSNSAIEAYKNLRIDYKLLSSNKINIIYNGCKVPTHESHPFKISSDKHNIAFCGRFEDYKGVHTLINTIIKISELYPERFIFHIIGDGTLKPQLQELTRNYNNVIIYPPTPRLSNKLYVFDYIFMPSHFEGLALISIESSLSKIPVIASIAPGLDETLPEDWPLRFYLKDEKKILKIFESINNKSLNVNALKEKAFNFATNNFSLEQMISSYSKLYQECYDK